MDGHQQCVDPEPPLPALCRCFIYYKASKIKCKEIQRDFQLTKNRSPLQAECQKVNFIFLFNKFNPVNPVSSSRGQISVPKCCHWPLYETSHSIFKMSAQKMQIRCRTLGRPLHFPSGFDDACFKLYLSKYSFLSEIPQLTSPGLHLQLQGSYVSQISCNVSTSHVDFFPYIRISQIALST